MKLVESVFLVLLQSSLLLLCFVILSVPLISLIDVKTVAVICKNLGLAKPILDRAGRISVQEGKDQRLAVSWSTL